MRKTLSENPKCNLCGGDSNRILFKGLTYWEYEGKFNIVQCLSCKLVFTSPRPKLSEMEKYYESKMYFGRDVEKEDDFEDEEFREEHYGPVYRIILEKKKKGSIFDIGAGTGMLLSKFRDYKWKTYGVELTHGAVSYALKKYKIRLLQGDFLQKKIDKQFDVIVLNGALEHLHMPFETLQKARTNLDKKGFIVISIPNFDSIGRRVFGRNWFAWQPPRHLYHFSPKTITSMLQKAGYKKIKIYHNFDIQNRYIIFQSARYMMSPKFKKKKSGGLAKESNAFKPETSFKKEIGKAFFHAFSVLLSKIEPIFRKGEVIIVYAEK